MGLARASLGVAASLSVLLAASTAAAFCRTTTCDVSTTQAGCTWDANGCAQAGNPLFWPDSCGWFGVEKDGSTKRSITYDQLHSAVVNAFTKWANADCGNGQKPNFALQDTDTLYGPVECNEREFNKNAANANTWMFRDASWPYVDSTNTIALTTLSVEISTGRILDADVELNSFRTDITTSDTVVGADLESIVTHESGHFLGLAHSAVTTATMYAMYSPSSTSIRNLDPDDEQGICAAYPPGTAPTCGQPEPIYGFSKYCGGVNPSTGPDTSGDKKSSCAVSLGSPTSGSGAALVALALSVGGVARRRRVRG